MATRGSISLIKNGKEYLSRISCDADFRNAGVEFLALCSTNIELLEKMIQKNAEHGLAFNYLGKNYLNNPLGEIYVNIDSFKGSQIFESPVDFQEENSRYEYENHYLLNLDRDEVVLIEDPYGSELVKLKLSDINAYNIRGIDGLDSESFKEKRDSYKESNIDINDFDDMYLKSINIINDACSQEEAVEKLGLMEAYEKHTEKLYNKFFIREGNCEADEEMSPACIEIQNTNDSNKLQSLFNELKEFEKVRPNYEVSILRAKESLLENPNTPKNVIEDISRSNLYHTYKFEYYGGYGGDDRLIQIDLVRLVEQNLEKHQITEPCSNFKYFKKKQESRELSDQMQMSYDCHGCVTDEFTKFQDMFNNCKKEIEKLEVLRFFDLSPQEQSKTLVDVLHAKIQKGESLSLSEFSMVNFESEAFNSLDDSVKETITNYVNERSDAINARALEQDNQRKQDSSPDL